MGFLARQVERLGAPCHLQYILQSWSIYLACHPLHTIALALSDCNSSLRTARLPCSQQQVCWCADGPAAVRGRQPPGHLQDAGGLQAGEHQQRVWGGQHRSLGGHHGEGRTLAVLTFFCFTSTRIPGPSAMPLSSALSELESCSRMSSQVLPWEAGACIHRLRIGDPMARDLEAAVGLCRISRRAWLHHSHARSELVSPECCRRAEAAVADVGAAAKPGAAAGCVPDSFRDHHRGAQPHSCASHGAPPCLRHPCPCPERAAQAVIRHGKEESLLNALTVPAEVSIDDCERSAR